MASSKFKLPDMTPAPRRVEVLADQRFFWRSVELVHDPEAGSPREQIELALEGMAPFPLSQMWWGFWTQPGVGHALVFASYQKRFTAEETEFWHEAEWVGPRMACLLAEATPPAATTWIVRSADGLTAVHFGDDSGVPTLVRSVELDEEADEAAQAEARDALLKQCGGSKEIQDLDSPDMRAGVPGTDELLVGEGDKPSRIPLQRAQDLDVRDNDELAAHRRARIRDRWMWRSMVAAVAIIALTAVAEVSLWGINRWLDGLHRQVQVQTPVVNEIETADRLANRIDELRTQRLRPFEMIAIADQPRPETLVFLRTQATGLYSLEVEAETDDATAVSGYVSELRQLGETQDVQVLNNETRGSRTTVRLLIEFSFDAFNTAATPAPEGSA